MNSGASISLLEAPTESLEHLLAAVTDPLLAQSLPADVGIEQLRRGVEITAPEGAEEVDHGAARLGTKCEAASRF
jgi:hypothetical protein